MGWSCTAKASATLERVSSLLCVPSTGMNNTWKEGGETFFFDGQTDVEHEDGSITGEVWRFRGAGAIQEGTFRIDPQGAFAQAPKIWITTCKEGR